MEILAVILCFISILAIIGVFVLLIYSIIKRNFKLRPKKLFLVLLGCIVFFVGTMIFYGAVQSPESKAKYEANQKAKAEEQAKEIQEDKSKESDKQPKSEVETTANIESSKDSEPKVEKQEEQPKEDSRFIIKADANTSAAVDEIIFKGKADSKNASKDDIKEAIKFINDNYNKYWTDNNTMQKTMYYGAILEYSNESKDIKKLGLDSEQVVKYVYRKADKIEDASTQSNLEQIKKSLDKIPSDLK